MAMENPIRGKDVPSPLPPAVHRSFLPNQARIAEKGRRKDVEYSAQTCYKNGVKCSTAVLHQQKSATLEAFDFEGLFRCCTSVRRERSWGRTFST